MDWWKIIPKKTDGWSQEMNRKERCQERGARDIHEGYWVDFTKMSFTSYFV